MRISRDWFRKQLACVLVMLLAAPLADAAQGPAPQAVEQQQQSMASVPDPGNAQEQHKQAAGAVAVKDSNQAEAALPESPIPAEPQATGQVGQGGQPAASPSSSGQQQTGDNRPVGTAAAPSGKTLGAVASRPAGAVIAPAKQKRARSLLIRVGVIVGAAVAIGTVVALSRASPSRP